MHKKDLGSFGEQLVSARLLKAGMNVYFPIGDNTKADLIVETPDNKLYKIQVKTKNREKASLNKTILYVSKGGPNKYQFKYDKTQVDYFAVVDVLTEDIAWIPSSILDECNYMISFSHVPTHKSDSKLFKDFVKIPF